MKAPAHLIADIEMALRHLKSDAAPVWVAAAASMARQAAEKIEAFVKDPTAEQLREATPVLPKVRRK